MKKIALILFAVLSFGLLTNAQESNVRFDKTRRGPDPNGVYTISLEAYVTGNVTVTTSPAPADIILVLDYSGSMKWSMSGTQWGVQAQNQRINILRSAVKDFVDIVQDSNDDILPEDRDDYGGHRIAFVLYSGGYRSGHGQQATTGTSVYESGKVVGTNGYTVPSNLSLNTLIDVDKLSTTAASGSGDDYIPATVKYDSDSNTGGLLSPDTSQGTWPGDAMEEAKSILSSIDYSETPDRSRIVVFFTDGQPSQTNQGTKCLEQSNIIKTSETYKATVYSVGLFNEKTDADYITTFLSYASSDPNNNNTTYYDQGNVPEGGWVNVSKNKSIIVSSAEQLANVFSDIASASVPSTSAASSSSVLVDIVSTSFKIPTNTDLGTVKVYQVPNIQASQSSVLNWPDRDDTDNPWVNITEKQGISLVSDPETGEVSVSGFDYGAEWCGWDASWKNEQGEMVGRAHGSKLVLEIPIMADVNAVGGPNVTTNAPGSKLVIKDKEGHEISTHEFISPVISLPVNIHIMKDGLKAGESAKFTIYRTTLPVTASSQWDYVSSVFVTNGESSATETVTVNSNNEILLTDEEKTAAGTYSDLTNPVTYVRGLPSAIKVQQDDATATLEYVYKVVEEPWGWTYSFQKATGYGVLSVDETTGAITAGPKTISDQDAVTSNMFVSNPIIFNNNRETNVDYRVRNAESKATNIFKPKSSGSTSGEIKYDDSKTNTGEGRETK